MSIRYALIGALLLATPAFAQQRGIDRELMDAGFVMRAADTPGKMAALQKLPPRKFVTRVKSGTRYYIYADPTDCRCAFVGYQKAYDTFRDMGQPPAPPPGMQEFRSDATQVGPGVSLRTQMVDDMNEDAGLWDGDDIFHLNFN